MLIVLGGDRFERIREQRLRLRECGTPTSTWPLNEILLSISTLPPFVPTYFLFYWFWTGKTDREG